MKRITNKVIAEIVNIKNQLNKMKKGKNPKRKSLVDRYWKLHDSITNSFVGLKETKEFLVKVFESKRKNSPTTIKTLLITTK